MPRSKPAIDVEHILNKGSAFITDNPMWMMFIDFLVERQKIWYKKEIQKDSAPWTADPILQEAKIINVYRELDRNTLYEINHIKRGENDPAKQIFKMVLFRHTNSPKLFEFLTGPIVTEEQFEHYYAVLHEQGNGVSRAMLFNTPRSMPYWRWVYRFWFDLYMNQTLVDKVLNASTARKMFDAFDDLPHIGEFFAYEMYTSATYYDWCRFTEDDFLVVGPGAIPGLEIMLGLPWETLYYKEAHWLVSYLAPLIREQLLLRPDYIWIPRGFQPKNPEDCKFTKRTLEHTLCEWRKYYTIKQGLVGIRRRYVHTVKV